MEPKIIGIRELLLLVTFGADMVFGFGGLFKYWLDYCLPKVHPWLESSLFGFQGGFKIKLFIGVICS